MLSGASDVSRRRAAAHDFHDRIEAIFPKRPKSAHGFSGLRGSSSPTLGAISIVLLKAYALYLSFILRTILLVQPIETRIPPR